MEFTYAGYTNLIEELLLNGYHIVDYSGWRKYQKTAILRHDIDTNIDKAVAMAELEAGLSVQATYFVLLTSDFYNVFSKSSQNSLKKILASGHQIGLHFDEQTYSDAIGNEEMVKKLIIHEAKLLGEALDYPIQVVSYHRPSREILAKNLEIPRIVNSYGKNFFQDMKYFSDSRRNWREPVLDVIREQRFDRMQIVTHAFWYQEKEENINSTVEKFVNDARRVRWSQMKENISNFEEIMPEVLN